MHLPYIDCASRRRAHAHDTDRSGRAAGRVRRIPNRVLSPSDVCEGFASPIRWVSDNEGSSFAASVAVRSVKRDTVFPHIAERVLPATTVYTDEYAVYNTLGATKGYAHSRVRHAERVYVDGDVHTNTIEGFWSLTKRGIEGVYHSVSRKHLQGYLNEYAWRYNQRFELKGRFEALLLRSTVL